VALSSKRLEILRHAKSSWADPVLDDHERPLNGRGRDAAELVGRHLRQTAPRPDLVLCSSAVRARQTVELLGLEESVDVLVEDELYGAGGADLMARLRRVPSMAATVLLVGHNPGIEQLARTLDRQGLASVAKFPTAALVVLALAIDAWPDLQPGTGQVESFFTPRDAQP
jgi:phosphohistidine phosphatase